MMNIKKDEGVTWQKQPYVWMIIFFPLLAIIGGIITTVLAVKSNDGLVVDDYYKQGLEINRTLERDKLAQDYQLKADIIFNNELEEVEIKLLAKQNFLYPKKISVTFLHATRAGLDKQANVLLTTKNSYRGHLSKLKPGKWYVHLQHGDWRLITLIHVKR